MGTLSFTVHETLGVKAIQAKRVPARAAPARQQKVGGSGRDASVQER